MRKYIIKYKKDFIFSILLGWLEVFSMYRLMMMIGTILDILLDKSSNLLSKAIIIAIFYSFLVGVTGILKEKYSQDFSISIVNDLRVKCINSIYNNSNKNFYNKSIEHYLSIVDQDLDQLRINYILNIPFTIISIGQVIIYMVGIYLIHPYILLVSLIFYVIPVFVSKLFVKPLSRTQSDRSSKNEIYIESLNELLKGYILIKQSGNKNKFVDSFSKKSMERLTVSKRLNMLNQYTFQTLYANNSATLIGIVAISGYLISKGLLNMGSLISSVTIVSMAANTVSEAVRYSLNVIAHKSFMEKILSEFNLDYKDIIDDSKVKSLDLPIKIENLSLHFRDKMIFSNLDLKIDENKTYAIIGKSGSGKSSLAKIIAKINYNYGGSIKISSYELSNISEKEMYDFIYYVPQEALVFRDSLINNISMKSKNPDYDKYMDILKNCNIEYLHNIYGDNIIDPDKLSGGEKTRVNLARSLYKNPKLIIFDEVTGGLDPKNAKKIEDLIFSINNVTKIIITHNWDDKYLEKFDYVINIDNYK